MEISVRRKKLNTCLPIFYVEIKMHDEAHNQEHDNSQNIKNVKSFRIRDFNCDVVESLGENPMRQTEYYIHHSSESVHLSERQF